VVESIVYEKQREHKFLLLPRDCLKEQSGRWVLTVRRTKLKKGLQKVGYSIKTDFTLHDYEIPEWMARDILAYMENSGRHRSHPKDTLFAPQRKSQLGYLTYHQMRHRLSEFREAATGREDYPVNLGDTRHLAMISLILSGGSPVVCRELAGHESIDISAWRATKALI